jgi:hypothetical protein
MIQRFNRGDLVHIGADLGPSMDHFCRDVDAVVLYSYASKYGGSDHNSYGVHLKGGGECSWYYGQQFTLIERGRLDLLGQWTAERKARIKQLSDHDWIFAQEYKEAEPRMPHGATVAALARDLGCDNLWGASGEGFVWYENASAVMSHAWRFLKASDKSGWLKYAAEFRAQRVAGR